ncbi:MAG: methyltransferase [Euryarchaeota archaeon]|jgi:tRNA wybutosine-synthesizing protein 3|nr:methyltransferase [Euryarchaeota archaeon]
MTGERQGKLSPYSTLIEQLKSHLTENNGDLSLLTNVPDKWEKHGNLLLLPQGSFEEWSEYAGTELWTLVAHSLGGQRLALKGEISGPKRRPGATLLLGEDSWVTHREHGIDYSFDITKSMFSAGNLPERGRMGDLDCSGETILDLYAGIGYYTLPLLVRAGATHVHACEWSIDAIHALNHNLEANKVSERCTIYSGDNKLAVAQNGSAAKALGTCDRVMLGLLPSSEDGWPLALAALKPEGGLLHIHGNAPSGGEEKWANSVVEQLSEIDSRKVELVNLVKVKWYSPHVRHCVLDIQIG